MSTIGPDAQEILTGIPAAPAGAAPKEPTVQASEPTPGGTAPGQPGPEDRTAHAFAEIDRKRKAAEDQASRYRAYMELGGYQFAEDDTPIPPQTRSVEPPGGTPPQVDPEVAELAASLGVDPARFQSVIDRRAGALFAQGAPSYISPLTGAIASQLDAGVAGDPDFQVYGQDFARELEKRVSTLPAHLQPHARIDPEIRAMALNAAKEKHFAERAKRWNERASAKVVGRFVEGAAPGSGAPNAPALSPEAAALAADMGLSPEIMAAAAANKAAREGRR